MTSISDYRAKIEELHRDNRRLWRTIVTFYITAFVVIVLLVVRLFT